MSSGSWLDMFGWTPSTLCLLIVTLAVAVLYLYKNIGTYHRNRYGVKYHQISGNILMEVNFRHKLANWLRQYGETFGLQSGSQLVLVTANLDLWRYILIKDFSNFIDREPKIMSSTPFFNSLFFSSGREWRKQRQILSPTFTSGKLKYISKSVQKSAQDLTDYLETQAKNGSTVLKKDVCGRYTSEIIAKTAFGLDAKFIAEEDAEFYEYSKNIFDFKDRGGLSKLIADFLQRIPFVERMSTEVFKLQYFEPIKLTTNKYFDVILQNTIRGKRLQQRNFCSRKDAPKVIPKLAYEEMLGHSMLVIFAGMETTATTLQMCFYELAANSEVQDKVFQEITQVVKSDTPTLEELNSLIYTQQVLDETLRLYPPVPSVKRIAQETLTYSGVTIPKGATVVLPYFSALKDPRFFKDPDTFNPNRFSPKEKEKLDPLAFCVFGHGPRICLGMRLAYLELKQALVHVIRKLRVVLNDETEPKRGSDGVLFKEHNLLVPEKPVALLFELRETSQ
ncbi:unnamed protein product [Candidula unifasciata]|uniref:Cytochrome P450 n=1 Tax=Candidula unifasciata TaxID=100452 RepID=A0A8S3YZY2_9EUPU|nr:unnamed protein product [Candidula unifasciata]